MHVVVPIAPVAKQRARVVPTRRGRRPRYHAYTPDETASAEDAVRKMAMGCERTPKPAGVRMDVTFYRKRPKSTPKKQLLPTTKPDVDNYFKLVADALNSMAYDDDGQITTLHLRKRFGDPRIEISCREDPGDVKAHEDEGFLRRIKQLLMDYPRATEDGELDFLARQIALLAFGLGYERVTR